MPNQEKKIVKHETKACLAYIVRNLLLKNQSTSLYDCNHSKQINFTGLITALNIDVTMEFPGSTFGWRIYSEKASESEDSFYFNLFNEPTMKPVELYIYRNGRFDGYDLDPQRGFQGFADSKTIFIRDFDFPEEHIYFI